MVEPRLPARTAARSCAMIATTAASILQRLSLCSWAPRLSCWALTSLAGPTAPRIVLTAPPGEPLRQSNRVPGYFKPAARPTTLRFSDLWHTAVSLLMRKGASINAVRKQLGHATASIALDTYGDLFPDELDALAGRLETSTAGRPAVLACRP